MSSADQRKKEEAFNRFLQIPHPSAQPTSGLPTVDAPQFSFRLIRETSPGQPEINDLWAVTNLSHTNTRIRRANPDMTETFRIGLYKTWYSANRKTILLLERTPADKHGVSIVGSSITLPLTTSTFELIQNGHLPVVGLGDKICPEGAAFDVLLLDTWVLHNDYQDIESFFGGRKKHGGYGNALPLLHLALFWKPSSKLPLELYAEPDSQSMRRLLEQLGFAWTAKTAIGEPLLKMEYPAPGKPAPEQVLDRMRMEQVARKIEECHSWPLA
jgi:hypothetical protein